MERIWRRSRLAAVPVGVGVTDRTSGSGDRCTAMEQSEPQSVRCAARRLAVVVLGAAQEMLQDLHGM